MQRQILESDQRRTYAALVDSEKRFRLLAENSHDWIFRVQLTEPRTFDYVSPACERLLGYTPDEIYQNPAIFDTLVHPGDRDLLENLRRSPPSHTESLALRYLTKDGRTVWVDLVRWPSYDDSGKLVAIEGAARDITERKVAEDEQANHMG